MTDGSWLSAALNISCKFGFFMKLFVLRHGESVANSEKRLPISDTPLTSNGIRQARQSAKHLAGCEIGVIYASPILRAMQTAAIISAELDCPIEIRPGLRDMSFGSLMGRKEDGSDEEVNMHLKQRQNDKLGYRFPGGENFYDIQDRVLPILNEVLSPGKSAAAIVSHLYPNRIIVSRLLGMPIEHCTKIRQPNGLVYRIDVNSRKARYWHQGTETEGLLLKDSGFLGPE